MLNKTVNKPLYLTTAGDDQHQASCNPEKQTFEKKNCNAVTNGHMVNNGYLVVIVSKRKCVSVIFVDTWPAGFTRNADESISTFKTLLATFDILWYFKSTLQTKLVMGQKSW